MADSLSTIGSIATHLADVFSEELTAGISGNLVIISDLARQHVSNFTGNPIGSNSINDKFQPPILDFAKADTVDLINASEDTKLKLAELTVEKGILSSEQYRLMGQMKLNAIGRDYKFGQSLS
jgi:hypothetical protein